MLNHSFTWNGHSSDEYGVKIERFRALNRPARKYDVANVQGRNGNLYALQNAWDEVLVSYEIFAQGASSTTNLLNMTYSNAYITPSPEYYTANLPTIVSSRWQIYNETMASFKQFAIKGMPELDPDHCWINYEIRNDGTTINSGQTTTDDIIISIQAGQQLLVWMNVATNGTAMSFTIPCRMFDLYERDLERRWTDIMEWLNSADGYAELSDTYDTQHYREAVFVDATDIANSWNEYGRAIVSFRCRPERYLISGQSVTLDFTNTTLIGYVNTWSLTLRASAPSGAVIGSLYEGEVLKILDSIVISSVGWYQVKTEDGTIGWCQSQYVLAYNVLIINNPTKHIAKPKISLTMGNGGLWMMLNRSILEVTGQANPLYIDCETENITGINGLGQPESYNKRATLSDGNGNPISNFLFLKSGENYISIEESANVSDVTIEMRLWEL